MKREVFRQKIEAELISYGYKPHTFIWQQNPSRLVLAIGGGFREIPIKATMRKEALAYELGRLKGWAEMLGLQAPTQSVKPVTSRQIDLEEVISGASA